MKFLLILLLLVTLSYSQLICVIGNHYSAEGGNVYLLDGSDGWKSTALNLVSGYCSFGDDGVLWMVSPTGKLYSTDCVSYISMKGTVPEGNANDISAHYGKVVIAHNRGVALYTGSFSSLVYSSAVDNIEHAIDEDSEVFCGMGAAFVVSYNLDFPETRGFHFPTASGLYDLSFGYTPTVICNEGSGSGRKMYDGVGWESHGISGPFRRIDISINGDVVEASNLGAGTSHIIYNDVIVVTSSIHTADIAVSDWSLCP